MSGRTQKSCTKIVSLALLKCVIFQHLENWKMHCEAEISHTCNKTIHVKVCKHNGSLNQFKQLSLQQTF